MLNNIHILDSELVKTIEWKGDALQYDLELSILGPKNKPFVVINPYLKDSKPFYFIEDIPSYHKVKCITWMYQDDWVAKYFPPDWKNTLEYYTTEIVIPKMRWVRNINLAKDISFKKTVYQNYDPDPYESKCELVWYLDPNSHDKEEKIWAFKLQPLSSEPIETRDMGFVKPFLPEKLDVIFISYNEPNAEKNWYRVLSKAPHAKRIHGVKGIFEAHKIAASLSSTELFFVVDGDAWLLDSWTFDINVDLYDRDCTYVWMAKNPYNNLNYGYGGVKLFSKFKLQKMKKWQTLDLSTSVSKQFKIVNKLSCVSQFDEDEFSVWKSAFRESVKLCFNKNSQYLENWVENKEVRFSEWAVQGVLAGVEFYEENKKDKKILAQINNIDWLRKKFNDTGLIFLEKSKTFCMAPWVHLHSNPIGEVYPCCISPEKVGDVRDSMYALINSSKMKKLRVDMMNDVKNPACITCYQHEEKNIGSFRHQFNRRFRSQLPIVLDKTRKDGTVDEFRMLYFDMRFQNICNFKCRTCHPSFSSSWEQEYIKRGLSQFKIHKITGEYLLPEVLEQIPNFEYAYFAGGEPLITQEHYILLEEMIRLKKTNIKLIYNSNVSNLKFKDKDILKLWSYFNHPIEVGASIDHIKERAEYIRHGTNWAEVESNLFRLKNCKHVILNFNTVVSVFNYCTLPEFYQYLIDKKLLSQRSKPFSAFNMNTPEYFTSQILPIDLKRIASDNISKFVSSLKSTGYVNELTNPIQETVNWAMAEHRFDQFKEQFALEILELDKVRNENFIKTFPELGKMLDL